MTRTSRHYWSQVVVFSPGEGEEFDLESGTTERPAIAELTRPAWGDPSTNGIPNSPRAGEFLRLSETIARMAQLSPSDPLHIDERTAKYATNLVGLMRSTFDLDAPKVFPQDAEAIVMTWEDGELAKLLTIAGDEVSLLDLHKSSQMRCYHDVADGEEAMPSLIPLLVHSAKIRSSAVEE